MFYSGVQLPCNILPHSRVYGVRGVSSMNERPERLNGRAAHPEARDKKAPKHMKEAPLRTRELPKPALEAPLSARGLPKQAREAPPSTRGLLKPALKAPGRPRTSQSRQTRQKKKPLSRITLTAICAAAVMLLCVFAAPNLIQSALGAVGSYSGYSGSPWDPGDPGDDNGYPPFKQPYYDEDRPEDLFLHKAAISGNVMELLLALTGPFPGDPYELLDAQIAALFPDPPILFGGVAFYFEGDFSQVLMYEKDPGGRMALFSVPSSKTSYLNYYMRTEVRFTFDGTIPLYDEEHQGGAPMVLTIQGTSVTVKVLDITPNDGVAYYYASFTVGGTSYRIKLADEETGNSGLDRLTEIATYLIESRDYRTWLKCGQAGFPGKYWIDDLVRPERISAKNDLLFEYLALAEAQADPVYGAFIPGSVPERFTFKEVRKTTNQRMDVTIFDIVWYVEGASEDEYYLWRHVGKPRFDAIFDWSVSVNEREKYDCSLIPVSPDGVEKIPEGFVLTPLFQAKEMTLEVVKAREDLRSYSPLFGRITFLVQFDDNTVVEIVAVGVSAEEVWEMLSEIL